jgi:hypothetical protein
MRPSYGTLISGLTADRHRFFTSNKNPRAQHHLAPLQPCCRRFQWRQAREAAGPTYPSPADNENRSRGRLLVLTCACDATARVLVCLLEGNDVHRMTTVGVSGRAGSTNTYMGWLGIGLGELKGLALLSSPPSPSLFVLLA